MPPKGKAKGKKRKDDSSEEESEASDDSFVVDDDESVSDYDDEDSDGDLAVVAWIPAGKPKCKYGKRCTRKNPAHFAEEAHPPSHPSCPKASSASNSGASAAPVEWVPAGKPKCKYGADCKRQNPTHFAEESHPKTHPMCATKDDDKDAVEWAPSGKPRCPFGIKCARANPTHFQEAAHPADHPRCIGATGGGSSSQGAGGGGGSSQQSGAGSSTQSQLSTVLISQTSQQPDGASQASTSSTRRGGGASQTAPAARGRTAASRSAQSSAAEDSDGSPPPAAGRGGRAVGGAAQQSKKAADSHSGGAAGGHAGSTRQASSRGAATDKNDKTAVSASAPPERKKRALPTLSSDEGEKEEDEEGGGAAKNATQSAAGRSQSAAAGPPAKLQRMHARAGAGGSEAAAPASSAGRGTASSKRGAGSDAEDDAHGVGSSAVGITAPAKDRNESRGGGARRARSPTPVPSDASGAADSPRAAEEALIKNEKDEVSSPEQVAVGPPAKKVPLNVVVWDTAAVAPAQADGEGAEGWDKGGQALGLPLLCADKMLQCDPQLAARAAMDAIGPFFERHRDVDDLRIVLVKEQVEDGSPALDAIKDACTDVDARLRVIASDSDGLCLAKLREAGYPCRFVAIENDRFLAKGKRPSRGRSGLVYDASGSAPGGLSYLGSATASRYGKKFADLWRVYPVEIPAASPLRSVQEVDTVLHVVCPSMRSGADGYVEDPAKQREALAQCYRNLLDAFHSLRRKA